MGGECSWEPIGSNSSFGRAQPFTSKFIRFEARLDNAINSKYARKQEDSLEDILVEINKSDLNENQKQSLFEKAIKWTCGVMSSSYDPTTLIEIICNNITKSKLGKNTKNSLYQKALSVACSMKKQNKSITLNKISLVFARAGLFNEALNTVSLIDDLQYKSSAIQVTVSELAESKLDKNSRNILFKRAEDLAHTISDKGWRDLTVKVIKNIQGKTN